MALQFRKFIDGIRVVPKTTGTSDQTGDLEVITSTGKLSYFNNAVSSDKNSPIVTEDHAATLKNKTINGDNNTISNIGLTSLSSGTPNTVLRYDHTGVVVGGNELLNSSQIVTLDSSDILTNKDIDGDLNTITNIDNDTIKADAGIARSKLAAAVTVNSIVINDPSGVMSELAITSGKIVLGDGTNQPAAVAPTGDVTIDSSGVTSVDFVGGKTDTQVATSVDDTIAATPNNTPDTIVKRSSTGSFATSEIFINEFLRLQTQTIACAYIIEASTPVIVFDDATVGELRGISGGIGQSLIINNQTLTTILIKNNDTTTALLEEGIITGTGEDISLAPGASLLLINAPFVTVSGNKWYVVGGSGGGGDSTISIAAGEVLIAGDSVYIDGTGAAKKVDAGDDNEIEFIGVTLDAAPTGSELTRVQTSGEVTISGASFTKGKPVFVDPLTPGGYTTSAPSSAGQWVIQVGVATSTDKIVINGAGSATAVKITSEVDPYVYASVVSISSNTTLTNGNSIVLATGGAGGITVTLPAPTSGKIFNIKKVDAAVGVITISPPSGTIDGAASKTLTSQYDSLTITSDGTNFFLI